MEPETQVTPDHDEYRAAARALIQEAVERHDPLGAVQSAEADREYRERQANAETRIKLARAIGEEPSEADLRLVATPSGQQQIEAILTRRFEDRRAALAEVNKPPRGRNDGSYVENFAGDVTGRRMAADRALHGVSQIARHRMLAEAGTALDGGAQQFAADVAARKP